MKKVSIIIPCYNQERYIVDAISSCLAQTYKNIEIVVINDGSSDNSSNVVKSFIKDKKNIIFIDNKENNGVVYARNVAIEQASGEYILPLDGDDKIAPSYVEKAVKILDENSNIGIVYCKAQFFGTSNEEWKLDDFSKENILYKNCIFSCSMFRKEDYKKVGGYRKEMTCGLEDWDFWIQILKLKKEPYKIDEILFYYRRQKEKTRSVICVQNIEKMYLEIFKNNIEMYVNNSQFIARLFNTQNSPFNKLIKKYRKLFQHSIYIIIFQMLIILMLIIFLTIK